jgi:hypothetical protein
MLSLKNRKALACFKDDLREMGLPSDVAVSEIAACLDKAEILKVDFSDTLERFVRVCPIHGKELAQDADERLSCPGSAPQFSLFEGLSTGHPVRSWLIYDADKEAFVGVADVDAGGFLLGDDLEPQEVKLSLCQVCYQVYRIPTEIVKGEKRIKPGYEQHCSKRCREAGSDEGEDLLWR